MKTPIAYYGGKQHLAGCITKLIPNHNQYIEPFFGGGAIFFAKLRSSVEVINDLNDNVINFYRQLKSNYIELNNMIKGTLLSESDHRKSKTILKGSNETELNRAWAFWVQTNMSFSNKIYGGFAFDNIGGKEKSLINKKIDFTNALSKRLEHTQIFCRGALDIIKTKDTKDSFFYIDPPYFNANMGHYGGYLESDFVDLLDALVSIKGKFLLSSYPSEILDKYKKENNWGCKELVQPVLVSHKIIGKLKTESLVYNYKLNNRQLLFLESQKHFTTVFPQKKLM